MNLLRKVADKHLYLQLNIANSVNSSDKRYTTYCIDRKDKNTIRIGRGKHPDKMEDVKELIWDDYLTDIYENLVSAISEKEQYTYETAALKIELTYGHNLIIVDKNTTEMEHYPIIGELLGIFIITK